MSLVYEKPLVIRFSHCDSTGLVFHPHIFTWAVDAEESFFREVVGEPIFGPGINEGMYTPMAGARAEFKVPLWAGDKVTLRLWIERLGKSSVQWFFCIVKDGVPAIWLTETLVFTRLSKGDGKDGRFCAVEIPQRIREKLVPYVRSEREPWQVFRTN